jgi:hypothetical protein
MAHALRRFGRHGNLMRSLSGGDATVNDRFPDASDDPLPLAAQAPQQGGWLRLALLALMAPLGAAVLLTLILGRGGHYPS